MTNEHLQTTPLTLLAFDFDGLLAPFDEDPRAAKLDPAAAEFLSKASAVPALVLAVASGRDAGDLASRLGDIPAYVIGSHGLEIRGPRGRTLLAEMPLRAELDEVVRRGAEVCRFRIESKQHGVAIHWRGIPYLHDRHPVVDRFRTWAAANDLEIIEGQCAVEARVRGAGKEAALRWVTSATAAGRVIFAGGDATDLGALRFAAENGRAFVTKSDDWPPPAGVTVVDSCADLMRMLQNEIAL